jgi:hypothetical protein
MRVFYSGRPLLGARYGKTWALQLMALEEIVGTLGKENLTKKRKNSTEQRDEDRRNGNGVVTK